MNIAIIEDSGQELSLLERCLQSYLSSRQVYRVIDTYTSGEAFLENWPSKSYDLVFLDILMEGISGIEVARKIRETDSECLLIFISSSKEYALQGFEVRAFDYLLKPIDEARLEKTLARLRLERSKQDVSLLPENQQALKFIPCTGHSRIYLLQMKDVAFVSSRMSGVYVTSHEGKEGFTELTLRTLESRTPLLRCHRQYLVNLAHLQEIRLEDNGQAELILRNGLTVPVSRRYLKSLKEAIGL